MSDKHSSISGIVRRATLLVFVGALVVGSAVFYFFFSTASMRHVEDEARALLGLALATRQYTVEEVTPLTRDLDGDGFHVEQVPSYAAQSVFRRITDDTTNYVYREAALNPTNPTDLATEFEAGLIKQFREDQSLAESKGVHWRGGDPVFYIARPITITDPECLTCHTTPEQAPTEMRAIYGDTGGYGWQMNQIIGAQILTVPVVGEYRSVFELVAIFAAMLIILFFLVALLVTLPLQRNVIQPIKRLAELAERSSLRTDTSEMPESDSGEIQKLSDAIGRLRASLSVSMKK